MQEERDHRKYAQAIAARKHRIANPEFAKRRAAAFPPVDPVARVLADLPTARNEDLDEVLEDIDASVNDLVQPTDTDKYYEDVPLAATGPTVGVDIRPTAVEELEENVEELAENEQAYERGNSVNELPKQQ